MSKIYEIDPDADTLVVVRPLPTPFAQWTEDDSPKTNGYAAPAEVHIKASSKHLSLASPFFRDRLESVTTPTASTATAAVTSPSPTLWGATTTPAKTNGVKESSSSSSNGALQADGRIHVVLDGLDGDAVTTVLNIVHGRVGGGRVPKKIDLEALARIAVVVDRFGLHDTVEVYADRWIDNLERTLSKNSANRSVVLWIYVAYVFRRPELFREATKIAIAQSKGTLPALPGLPLRPKIVEDIDAHRQAAISKALDVLEATVDNLVNASGGAASEDQKAAEANAYLLGTLIKTVHDAGLAWPRPAAPYPGVSVAAISQAAHGVQSKAWGLSTSLHRLGVKGPSVVTTSNNSLLLLTPQIDNIRADLVGLDLKSDLGYLLY